MRSVTDMVLFHNTNIATDGEPWNSSVRWKVSLIWRKFICHFDNLKVRISTENVISSFAFAFDFVRETNWKQHKVQQRLSKFVSDQNHNKLKYKNLQMCT